MHRLRLNPAKSSGKPEFCSIPFVFDQMTAWGGVLMCNRLIAFLLIRPELLWPEAKGPKEFLPIIFA